MGYDISKFEDVVPTGKGIKTIDSRSCRRCKEKFVIGKIIYRIIEQDYQSGYGNNSKKQTNKMKLCKKCFDEIFAESEKNDE